MVQPDGRIVSGGETEIDGTYKFVATRMLIDGKLDPSFGSGGVTLPHEGGANAIALQPDGKIVLAGSSGAGNSLAFTAVRLLPDGSVDTSFGSGGIATIPIGFAAIANAIAIQPDGKIVLGGTAWNGHLAFAAARLNPDGSIDRSFGTDGVTVLPPDATNWAMTLNPDGTIVLAGQTDSLFDSLSALVPAALLPGSLQAVLGYGRQFITARLLPNGTPDPSFGNDGIVTVPIDATAIAFGVAHDQSGRVVVVGNSFSDRVLAVAVRLLPNGALDPSFGTGGVDRLPLYEGVNAGAVEPNGDMILAGVGATVIRLLPNGQPDPAFGSGGTVTVPSGGGAAANGVTVAPNQRLILSGSITVAGRLELAVMRIGG